MKHITKRSLDEQTDRPRFFCLLLAVLNLAYAEPLSAWQDGPVIKVYNTKSNSIRVWVDHSWTFVVPPESVTRVDVSEIQTLQENVSQLCLAVEETDEHTTFRNVIVVPVDLSQLEDVKVIWGKPSVQEEDFESSPTTVSKVDPKSNLESGWRSTCDHRPGEPSDKSMLSTNENAADVEVLGEFLFINTGDRSFFCNELSMVFFSIPSGSFGTTQRPAGRTIEVTQDYYISTTEVTKGQYAQIIEAYSPKKAELSFPMTDVKWKEATQFCQSLPGQSDFQYNLPTEAQWERACRGDLRSAFNPRSASLDEIMWYSGNSGGKTHKVASLLPNTFGIYDMHGNVREWCRDWWSNDGYFGKDPKGADKSTDRVRRGGAYDVPKQWCSSGARDAGPPWIAQPWQGFRVVLERN